GADVDDQSRTFTAHGRKHRSHHPQHAENIRIEQGLCLLDACFLDCTDEVVASIVHEDVDSSGLTQDGFDACCARGIVADGGLQKLYARKVFYALRRAYAAVDLIALARQQLGGSATNSRGSTCN